MTDAVTVALAGRATLSTGLATTIGVSTAVHAVLLTLLVLAPPEWRQSGPRDDERVVMTVSLGGAPGPRAGGMTAMGGRPVQEVAPREEPRRPEPPRAPAARLPEMVEPTRPAPARPVPQPARPERRQALPDAASRTPTRGAAVQAGSAVAQTGGTGIGFGLSTGGGGTGGEINLGDFCCPEYLQAMLQIIQRNWNSRQQIAGTAAVRFTIRRDGSLTGVELVQPSGFAVLDLAAQRAVLVSRLPPLPAAYTHDHLTITLTFEYQR